jgi:hypothetical protein
MAIKALTRFQKNLLGIALAFVILGAGNMIFAQVKMNEYREILTAEHRPQLPRRLAQIPILDRTINLDKDQEHIAKIHARIDFYLFVRTGGKFILALGGLTLVGMLFSLRNSAQEVP